MFIKCYNKQTNNHPLDFLLDTGYVWKVLLKHR